MFNNKTTYNDDITVKNKVFQNIVTNVTLILQNPLKTILYKNFVGFYSLTCDYPHYLITLKKSFSVDLEENKILSYFKKA